MRTLFDEVESWVEPRRTFRQTLKDFSINIIVAIGTLLAVGIPLWGFAWTFGLL